MREAGRLRNGLARDAPATFLLRTFPQILMRDGVATTILNEVQSAAVPESVGQLHLRWGGGVDHQLRVEKFSRRFRDGHRFLSITRFLQTLRRHKQSWLDRDF